MKSLYLYNSQLQDILAGEEYRIYYRQPQNPLAHLLQGLKDWLYSILKNIFPQTDVANTAAEWLAYGIMALGLIILCILLYLLVSRFARQGRLVPRRVVRENRLTPTVQHHFVTAQGQAERGDYTSALRHLFLGFILYLDQNRWIEAKTWKTNWEYFAELQDRAPHLAKSFTTLAVKFEEAMYGGRPISKDDYWFYRDQVSGWIQEGEAT